MDIKPTILIRLFTTMIFDSGVCDLVSQAPIADAVTLQEVNEGVYVQLDGSIRSVLNTFIKSNQWEQTSKTMVLFSNTSRNTPNLTLFLANRINEISSINLTKTDNNNVLSRNNLDITKNQIILDISATSSAFATAKSNTNTALSVVTRQKDGMYTYVYCRIAYALPNDQNEDISNISNCAALIHSETKDTYIEKLKSPSQAFGFNNRMIHI